jgi:DNA topoisomerase-3
VEKILWIAEKESQLSQGVFSVLPGASVDRGPGWVRRGEQWCVWLDGHAFQQATPDYYLPDDIPLTAGNKKVWRMADLPVIPGNRAWKLIPDPRKKQRLAKLKELLKWCDVVYHLGDPDEEGQCLVDEALEYFAFDKPVRRILINDYNAKKIRESLANIRDNGEPLFTGWRRWGLARSRYDWLLGMNGTRAMTLRGRELGQDGLLPVGSVQTPLLYIARERDRQIEAFVSHAYQVITVELQPTTGQPFKARWVPASGQTGLDEDGRLIDPAVAESILKLVNQRNGSVTECTLEEKAKMAPLPLSMNELQMEGFSRHDYTAQQVMTAAQTLYDTYKVITYPRTDVRYLSEAHHEEAAQVIAAVLKLRPDFISLSEHLDPARKSRAFNDAKVRTPTGEPTPHHGIVPSIPENLVSPTDWTECERNVYEVVIRAYLAQFAIDYKYQATSIRAQVEGESFITNGATPLQEGWKAIYKEPPPLDGTHDSNEQLSDIILPELNVGDQVHCLACEQAKLMTSPPSRFDDNMLLDAMKNVHRYVVDPELRKRLKDGEGIGTTSTRAGIIEDMKARGLFVPATTGRKKLMTSAQARNLIDALPMQVKDPAQAGHFKRSLDEVASGSLPLAAFMQYAEGFVREVVDLARSADMSASPVAPSESLPCPNCVGELQNKGKRTICKKCDFVLWHEVSGKLLSRADIEALLKKGETRVIAGFVSRDKQKKYSARLILDRTTGKTKPLFDQANTTESQTTNHVKLFCPRCNSELVKTGKALDCSACNLKFWTEILGKELTSAELNTLLSTGITANLSGFVSKTTQRAFSAHLKLNRESWKIEFEFDKKESVNG